MSSEERLDGPGVDALRRMLADVPMDGHQRVSELVSAVAALEEVESWLLTATESVLVSAPLALGATRSDAARKATSIIIDAPPAGLGRQVNLFIGGGFIDVEIETMHPDQWRAAVEIGGTRRSAHFITQPLEPTLHVARLPALDPSTAKFWLIHLG